MTSSVPVMGLSLVWLHNTRTNTRHVRENSQKELGLSEKKVLRHFFGRSAENDPLCRVFLARCRRLMEDPPSPDWNGVWALERRGLVRVLGENLAASAIKDSLLARAELPWRLVLGVSEKEDYSPLLPLVTGRGSRDRNPDTLASPTELRIKPHLPRCSQLWDCR